MTVSNSKQQQKEAYEIGLTTVSDALAFVPILVNIYGYNSLLSLVNECSCVHSFASDLKTQRTRKKEEKHDSSMKIINFGVLTYNTITVDDLCRLESAMSTWDMN